MKSSPLTHHGRPYTRYSPYSVAVDEEAAKQGMAEMNSKSKRHGPELTEYGSYTYVCHYSAHYRNAAVAISLGSKLSDGRYRPYGRYSPYGSAVENEAEKHETGVAGRGDGQAK